MTFQVEILKVQVAPQGKFRVAIVDHKLVDGKVDSKRLVSFGAGKAAFDVLSKAQQGDQFDIDSQKIKNEKDGKEYWTWVSAVSVGKNGSIQGSQSSAGVARVAQRSTYETPEERAAKQVYIVRQSSISNALEYLSSQPGTHFSTDEVIGIAKEFEVYVFGNEPVEPAEVN